MSSGTFSEGDEMRLHADQCESLVYKHLPHLTWAASTLLSFGACYFSLGDVSTAKALVESGMRRLAELERRATQASIIKIIILRTVIAIIYNEWNEPYRDVSASFQPLRAYLKRPIGKTKSKRFTMTPS